MLTFTLSSPSKRLEGTCARLKSVARSEGRTVAGGTARMGAVEVRIAIQKNEFHIVDCGRDVDARRGECTVEDAVVL